MARRRPNSKVYRDLPVSSFEFWETVSLVKQALRELEIGYFKSAAYLVDAMGRDDRVSGVLSKRVNGLLALPLDFEPAQDSATAKKVAEASEQAWPTMVDEAASAQLHEWGVMLGVAVAEKLWDTSGEVWTPKLKVWHPSFIWWRWDTYSYWINTLEGPVELPEGGNDKWVVYTPYGYYRGWMKGKVRALALLWLMRGWARRDWARYNELYGLGMIKAIVPPTANETDPERVRFVDGLANRGNEPVIECQQDKDGNKFDFELVEMKGTTGFETFPRQIGDVDAAIAITLLGQNLTTEGGRQGGGAYALGKVHYAVEKAVAAADNTTLGRTYQHQLLKDFAQYNFGDAELAPLPQWEVEPPEDKVSVGDALQKLGSFLTSAKNAQAPVDVRALLEQQGVPVLTEAQEAQQKAEAAERAAQAAAALQAGPGPGDAGDEPEQDLEGEPTKASLQLLARGTKGARRGQAYADDLAASSATRAAAAVEPELHQVLAQVRMASSAKDLRERLVRLFSHLGTKALEEITVQAFVMAELDGRAAVLEDLK